MKKLQEMFKKNVKKQIEGNDNTESLKASELKKKLKQDKKALKNQMSDLQDLDDVVNTKKTTVNKRRGVTFDNSEEPNNKKSSKKEEGDVVKMPRKLQFDKLKGSQSIEGDEVYQAESQKLRDRKVARKEVEASYKEQDLKAKEAMGKSITRNVQRDIISNKGLTRRRPKKDRNPRVKRRLKYEEMEKKRKNVVKEFKGGKQALYKGEESGIKTGLVRGIKM
jgi:hypothetical protein